MELDGFSALPWEMRSSHRVSQLLAIAGAEPEDRAQQYQKMEAYLRSHATVAAWLAHRPRIRETPHFAQYLAERNGSRYERAIEALGAGTASADDLELVRALGMEIAESSLVVRSRQILLSGSLSAHRVFDGRYEQFLWATIHPVSAVQHAEVVHTGEVQHPLPTVHVLHLERDLPALLGRNGSQSGYDFLLPRRLRMQVFATHESSRLTVREVLLGF